MASDKSFESLSLSSLNLNGGDIQQEQPSLMTLIKSVCADKDFATLATILKHTRFVPIDPIDENGNTILHFIISNFQEMGGAPFLQTFLSNPDSKKLLNKQSEKSGLTPAVLACSLKLFNVIDMLIDAGADINIKSRDGSRIQPATTEQMTEQAPAVKQAVPESSPSVFKTFTSGLSSFLSGVSKKSPQSQSAVSSLELSRQQTERAPRTDIALPAESIVSSLPGMTSVAPLPQSKKQISEEKTDAYLQSKKQLAQLAPTEPQPNKEQIFENGSDERTSEFMNNVIKSRQPSIASNGGGRSVVVGQRYLNNIPELSSTISFGGYRKKKSSKKDDKKKSTHELGRQTDDLHQKVLEKIMELMGVDEQTAKLYKSIIYYKVKNDQPSLTSYERAIEMEKLVTKKKLDEILKKVDIEAEKKLREKAFADSSSSESDSEKPKKKGKKEEKKVEKKELKKDGKKKVEEKKKKPAKETSSSSSSSVAETSSPDLDTLLE
jgi:hypothetical protein